MLSELYDILSIQASIRYGAHARKEEVMTIDMLARLAEAERVLPELLRDEAGWTGLFVDYERPFVERLWRPWGSFG